MPDPYIPENIRVHIGPPARDGNIVTVSFRDYIKNVASSEVYPTWNEQALRANILAQISFALNRVYLEYYPSRGYDFDITSSTAYDQKFIPGRDIFDNISQLVDELFQSYVRRTGTIEPLSTAFCNGTTVTCSGLSQWGSQNLAEQGRNYLDILKNYYGENIEIVSNVPVQGLSPSYPGSPLRLGSAGPSVLQLQGALNRISRNYPAIPKIPGLDGLFGQSTEDAVKQFQSIFNLTPDGVVGPATWYEIVAIYVAVTRLSELRSEGQRYRLDSYDLPQVLSLGSSGRPVSILQYMLNVISEFIPEVPSVTVDGQYGISTRDAVLAYQRYAGLRESGITGSQTWDSIYNRFSGITNIVFDNASLFDNTPTPAVETIADVQRAIPAAIPVFSSTERPRITGFMDRNTSRAVSKIQSELGLRPTGQITPSVKTYLSRQKREQNTSKVVRFRQFPGIVLTPGAADRQGGSR